MKIVQFLLFLLICAALRVTCAVDQLNKVEPNPFYLGPVSHHDRLLQETLFDKRNFEPGEEHTEEVYHFEESSGIFRWQKSKFRLHHHFLNLDLTLGVQRIECSPLKKVLALHTTNSSLAHLIHEGHYLYFGRGWASGCHLHHDNGIEGMNLFEVTEVVSITKKKFFWRLVATIRPGDPMEIFEDGQFTIYQENIRSPNSRKFEGAFFEEEEDVPSEDHEGHIDNFRKRNLPENIHQILQKIQEEDERGEGIEGKGLTQGERGRERRQMIKRSIWGWIKDKASRAGQAIAKTVNKVAEKAKESGKKAVSFLKEKATGAYQWVKNKLASAIDGTYTKSFRPELPLRIQQTFGPLTLSGQLKFGVNIAISFTIKSFKLSRFHFEIIGSASASIGARVDAGKFKRITFELPVKAEANFNIPTPIPGLFFQINPYLKVGGSVTASFTLQASLGSISASGQVGASADYTPGPGWNVRPITSFSWRLTKPSLGQSQASLDLEVIPKVGINFGASALGILNLRGGPQLQLPLRVSLTASGSCPLGFRWSFTIALAIHFDFSIFSKAMFEREFSKDLIPAKGDGYCLLGAGEPGQAPSSGGTTRRGGKKTGGSKKSSGGKKKSTGGKKKSTRGKKKSTGGKKKSTGGKKRPAGGKKGPAKARPTPKRNTPRRRTFHS